MDLKKEVRRRIEELTRCAYERGYRDGVQSALAEIEKAAGEDLAEQAKAHPASLQALGKTAAPDVPRRAAAKKQVQQRKGEAERCRAQGHDSPALHTEAHRVQGRGAS